MSDEPTVFGFLQLCADRRFHRPTMTKFEEETGLEPGDYWIEAQAGGAPSWDRPTKTAEYAYEHGLKAMGWAAHGDGCGGFPGVPDDVLREMLVTTARARKADFPRAGLHYMLFGRKGGEIEVVKL